jgi:hypothetical protein
VSSHFGGSHFASSHFDSSHYGGVGVSVIVPRGGLHDDFLIRSRRKLARDEEEFIALLVMAVEVIERDREN